MFNQMIAKMLPYVPKPVVGLVAKRYVAGETLDEAVKVVSRYGHDGFRATLDVLGEYVVDHEQVAAAMRLHEKTLDAVFKNDLPAGMSVKLSSLGLLVDEKHCYENLKSIVSRAAEMKRFVRIDMENSPYTDRTLDMYRRLRADGLDNVGVVIQACLKRSESDIRSLGQLKANVRLCKGIYIEPETISYRGREEIRENYKRLLALLVENKMPVAIATHDDPLLDYAGELMRKKSVPKRIYEYQMLLGVRERVGRRLVEAGERVRLYVPFGKDWYGYSVRRLRENPSIAGHVFRAMFLPDG